MKLLADKTAVSSGANRGIGRAMLEVFAAQGANLHACARKPDPAFESHLAQLAEDHSVDIQPVYMDLENHDEVRMAPAALPRQRLRSIF